jgi:hypothetical protein
VDAGGRGRSGSPPQSAVKNSSTVLKKFGFKESLSPNFLIPASFSHRISLIFRFHGVYIFPTYEGGS